MFGFYDNFPANIHRIDTFVSSLSNRKLQQRLNQVLQEINRRTFSFEEVGNPTVPGCTVIFELGIADAGNFNFLDEEEAARVLSSVSHKPLRVMDLFCGIRYYKNKAGKKTPLKFDYYMIRLVFGEEKSLEFQVFHERGPRYVSPEDLVAFLVKKVNEASSRKILKLIEPA
jgi:hypothetical protein